MPGISFALANVDESAHGSVDGVGDALLRSHNHWRLPEQCTPESRCTVITDTGLYNSGIPIVIRESTHASFAKLGANIVAAQTNPTAAHRRSAWNSTPADAAASSDVPTRVMDEPVLYGAVVGRPESRLSYLGTVITNACTINLIKTGALS